MRIVILNGSPKGDLSVTLQYVRYIQKHFPQHCYRVCEISRNIRSMERGGDDFDLLCADIDGADAILWATPVYTLFVPAQAMRFIELVHARGKGSCFAGKSTAVITTSIHFYDHTAHRYMQAVCEGLGMNYLGRFSAEMNDMLHEQGRNKLLIFAERFFRSADNQVRPQRRFGPLPVDLPAFVAGEIAETIDPEEKKIVIVTDANKTGSNLSEMIKRFCACLSGRVEQVNLWDLEIKGGCTGCLRCGDDNTCIYDDDFGPFYRSKVLPADIVVYAMQLAHGNMSSRFKTFFDRRFFMNHAPDMAGKQVAFLVSGPVGQLPYMYDFFEGGIEWQNGNVAGIVRDDAGDAHGINQNLFHLAHSVVRLSEAGYCSPQTFLGVGGRKIFRDDIWGRLRFVFHADYTYYKKHRLFDFPHNNYRSRMFNAVMRTLTKIPAFRRAFYKRLKSEQHRAHKKVVERY